MINFLGILGVMGAIILFAAVVVGHDRPSIAHILGLDSRHPHPAVNIEQPRGIAGAGLNFVRAIDPDFLTKNVSADVRIPRIDPIGVFFAHHLLFEVALVGIVILPELRRVWKEGGILGASGFAQKQSRYQG